MTLFVKQVEGRVDPIPDPEPSPLQPCRQWDQILDRVRSVERLLPLLSTFMAFEDVSRGCPRRNIATATHTSVLPFTCRSRAGPHRSRAPLRCKALQDRACKSIACYVKLLRRAGSLGRLYDWHVRETGLGLGDHDTL